eukprot:scaffold2179_cov165-Amphora_coffeaeformis.AAC.14
MLSYFSSIPWKVQMFSEICVLVSLEFNDVNPESEARWPSCHFSSGRQNYSWTFFLNLQRLPHLPHTAQWRELELALLMVVDPNLAAEGMHRRTELRTRIIHSIVA